MYVVYCVYLVSFYVYVYFKYGFFVIQKKIRKKSCDCIEYLNLSLGEREKKKMQFIIIF